MCEALEAKVGGHLPQAPTNDDMRYSVMLLVDKDLATQEETSIPYVQGWKKLTRSRFKGFKTKAFFKGQKKHINFFNIIFLAPARNPTSWAPKKSLCASFPGRKTQKVDPHNFFWGGGLGVKRGPKQAIFGHKKFSFLLLPSYIFSCKNWCLATELPQKRAKLSLKSPFPRRLLKWTGSVFLFPIFAGPQNLKMKLLSGNAEGSRDPWVIPFESKLLPTVLLLLRILFPPIYCYRYRLEIRMN